MSFKYGLLALLGIVIILVLGIKNFEIWTSPVEATPEKPAVRKAPKTEPAPFSGTRKETALLQSSLNIAQKNIFNPERKDFPLPALSPALDVKKPAASPQIVLHGVAIVGDQQYASIVNPGRSLRKEGRETMTLKLGDSVGEYKVAKILPDRIILEGAEDSFEVLLHDPKIDKKRSYVKTENKPALVTSQGPAPTIPSEKPSEIPRPQPMRPLPAVSSPPPESLVPTPTPITSPLNRRGRAYAPRSGIPLPTPAPDSGVPEEPTNPPLRP